MYEEAGVPAAHTALSWLALRTAVRSAVAVLTVSTDACRCRTCCLYTLIAWRMSRQHFHIHMLLRCITHSKSLSSSLHNGLPSTSCKVNPLCATKCMMTRFLRSRQPPRSHYATVALYRRGLPR